MIESDEALVKAAVTSQVLTKRNKENKVQYNTGN